MWTFMISWERGLWLRPLISSRKRAEAAQVPIFAPAKFCWSGQFFKSTISNERDDSDRNVNYDVNYSDTNGAP